MQLSAVVMVRPAARLAARTRAAVVISCESIGALLAGEADAGHGCCGQAFGTAGEAQFFGGGGFDTDVGGNKAEDGGDAGLHGGAVGTDFRAFADDSDVYEIYEAGFFSDEMGGMGEELIGGRAFPLRV